MSAFRSVRRVGAGVTVGESHRDYDRDRVREKTVVKEREPTDRTTVIKKERGDGVVKQDRHSQGLLISW